MTADAVPAGSYSAGALTDVELRVLAFERQWWRYAGAKEQAVHDLFGWSPTRYFQVLNDLIDNPAAMIAEPLLIKRLRRVRAARQRDRSQRRLSAEPRH